MMAMRVMTRVSNTNIVFSAPGGSFCNYNPTAIAIFPSSGLFLIECSCNYCHLKSEVALNEGTRGGITGRVRSPSSPPASSRVGRRHNKDVTSGSERKGCPRSLGVDPSV